VVEIGDNGPGIPPEIEPHIFDPFFTTKGIGEGMGLGLNTVQTIVRKHGGSIQVSSRPGDTRFQVWLPCVDPSALELPTES
jgi:signal transduction histidine kinase